MSVEIDWETITSGSDGITLAESIRAFVDDKFQEVTLPRFIRSVKVHAFDFGNVPPEVELKDICDPLSDFYEDNGDNHESDEENEIAKGDAAVAEEARALRERRREERWGKLERNPSIDAFESGFPRGPANLDRLGLRANRPPMDQAGPFLSRASTPGIHGGTSNLGYFHFPLSSGLSGTATPLAAVAGAHFPGSWLDQSLASISRPGFYNDIIRTSSASGKPQATSNNSGEPDSSPAMPNKFSTDHAQHGHGGDDTVSPSPPTAREPSVEDIQIVLRVKYQGNIKLSLTAEILLDYPMPSFVGIPLKLNITGLAFDGVAILAYIKKRAHFCFLSPEDADALIGSELVEDAMPSQHNEGQQQNPRRVKAGGLLEEIKVESEIGQKENGKQVLKNVGKVERFVLEQVRRIFEDEFVYPSFWTFLV